MSAYNFKTVLVKGDPLVKEAKAGGAITPGHLLGPDTGTVVVHATAGGDVIPRFALEYSEIGDGIADAYASGDMVKYAVFRPGDEVFALVAAGASAISKGDPLESAGDGTLRKHSVDTISSDFTTTTVTVYTRPIVAYALEAVNNSGGPAATRILVETV